MIFLGYLSGFVKFLNENEQFSYFIYKQPSLKLGGIIFSFYKIMEKSQYQKHLVRNSEFFTTVDPIREKTKRDDFSVVLRKKHRENYYKIKRGILEDQPKVALPLEISSEIPDKHETIEKKLEKYKFLMNKYQSFNVQLYCIHECAILYTIKSLTKLYENLGFLDIALNGIKSGNTDLMIRCT